jgi:hypothetical protein
MIDEDFLKRIFVCIIVTVVVMVSIGVHLNSVRIKEGLDIYGDKQEEKDFPIYFQVKGKKFVIKELR